MTELMIKSSFDGTDQPSLFSPAKEKNRPLLVALHTWSYDRFNQVDNMLPLCEELDLNLLLPEFRGPNLDTNPHCRLACGSDAAIADVYDAIEYVLASYPIDRESVFLTGLSGGGHMTLLVLKEKPKFFRAACTFCALTDVGRWADECTPNYRRHIMACTGGEKFEMIKRSPIFFAPRLADASLKLFHGKDDGVIPMEHSLRLYNEIRRLNPKADVYLDIFRGRHQMTPGLFREWLLSELCDTNIKITG